MIKNQKLNIFWISAIAATLFLPSCGDDKSPSKVENVRKRQYEDAITGEVISEEERNANMRTDKPEKVIFKTGVLTGSCWDMRKIPKYWKLDMYGHNYFMLEADTTALGLKHYEGNFDSDFDRKDNVQKIARLSWAWAPAKAKFELSRDPQDVDIEQVRDSIKRKIIFETDDKTYGNEFSRYSNLPTIEMSTWGGGYLVDWKRKFSCGIRPGAPNPRIECKMPVEEYFMSFRVPGASIYEISRLSREWSKDLLNMKCDSQVSETKNGK